MFSLRPFKARVLAAIVAATVLAVAWTAVPAQAEETSVSTAEELLAAAQGGGTVTLSADIQLNSTLDVKSGTSMTVTGNHKITFDPSSYTYEQAGNGQAAVFVESGASLTLAGGASLDGAGFTNDSVSALYNNGSFVLDGGSIANFKYTNPYDPAFGGYYGGYDTGNRSIILSEGQGASFEIKSGSIKGNVCNNPYSARGVLEVSQGAKLTMTGGEISGNKAVSEFNTQAIVIVGVSQDALTMTHTTYEDPGATFEFSGGTIKGNEAQETVFVGETSAAFSPYYYQYEDTFTNVASMTMGGSAAISGNTAHYIGGGVAVRGPGRLTMDGGTISGNSAPAGGGVATLDSFAMGYPDVVLRSDATYGGTSLKDWSETRPAAFTMNGGTISDNKAISTSGQPVGGGVYVSSNEVYLNAGTISGNTAGTDGDGQGGGVYVSSMPYTVHLSDTLVTGNEATLLGGGMWLCPSGAAHSYLKNGGAIIANSSEGAGDDVVSLSKDREGGDTGARLSLLNVMLGGWVVDWYQDGAVSQADGVLGQPDPSVARYPELVSKLGGIVTDNSDDIALKAVTGDDDAAVAAARSKAKLVITGNKAARGGGIGANGSVQFGEEQPNYETIDITVKKEWSTGTDGHPSSVYVGLYRDGVQIDRVELGEDNGWTHTWTELPKYVGDDQTAADGKALSSYTVKEEPVDGYSSQVTPGSIDADSADKTFTVTNGTDGAPAPAKARVSARKVLEGATLTDGQFSFELVDESGQVVSTARNAADGTITFDELTYDEAGEHTYTVREVLPDDDDPDTQGVQSNDVTFDTSVYKVAVKVTSDQDGNLTAEVQGADGNATPVFTNTYDKPSEEKPVDKELPQTGDASVSPAVVAVAAVIGIAAFAVGCALARRHRG